MGLSLDLHVEWFAPTADVAHRLALWFGDPVNPLVEHGLVTVAETTTTQTARSYLVPTRVLAHLRGDVHRDPRLAMITGDGPSVAFDADQERARGELRAVLSVPTTDVIVVLEGPVGPGRRTAAAFALRREAFLTGALPLIADADAWPAEQLAGVRVPAAGLSVGSGGFGVVVRGEF